jgi:glycosyltransferase involved in cell wall biosynthesis
MSYAFGDEYRSQVVRRSEELGLAEVIHWQGPIAYSGMPDWYRTADVVISVPSSDSSPKTVYEAMACGVPVIISDLPWAASTLEHERHVIKVPMGAPQAIAAAVERLSTSSDLRRRLIEESLALVERAYDFHHHMGRMECLMAGLIAGNPPAPAELLGG